MISSYECAVAGVEFICRTHRGTTPWGGDDRSEVTWLEAYWTTDWDEYLMEEALTTGEAPWPKERPAAGEPVPTAIADWIWDQYEDFLLEAAGTRS